MEGAGLRAESGHRSWIGRGASSAATLLRPAYQTSRGMAPRPTGTGQHGARSSSGFQAMGLPPQCAGNEQGINAGVIGPLDVGQGPSPGKNAIVEVPLPQSGNSAVQ